MGDCAGVLAFGHSDWVILSSHDLEIRFVDKPDEGEILAPEIGGGR